MRLTNRDMKLLKDMALSHVLSRDQVVQLGYFSSVTRANTRLRELRNLGLVRRIDTPYFAQGLYVASAKASGLLGERIGSIVSGRAGSPRFLQHALSMTNVRIALIERGATGWRFEQQLKTSFTYGGRTCEVRPDGMAIFDSEVVAVEVDLGHVAPSKFRAKLLSYDAFARSGEAKRLWHTDSLKLLAVTTGPRRARRLRELSPQGTSLDFQCLTFDELNLSPIGGWS